MRNTGVRAWLLFASMAVLSLGAVAAAPGASAAQSGSGAAGPAAAAAPPSHDFRSACASAAAGYAACLALIRSGIQPHLQPAARSAARPDAAPAGYGYGPDSLQSAYKLPSATNGAGQTVAIVDAYNDPNASSDLAAYRAAWGLPACGAGCFSVVNENGQASPLPANAAGTGWDVEESLDIDMVSAICPNCHILLVEANSASDGDLGTAVNSAVALGAKFVSNSYGGPDSNYDSLYDNYYDHPGVAVTASAGDFDYEVEYPASSEYVTAVGGTTLTPAGNSRGWNETVWSGSGSGCSTYEPKQYWQHDGGCYGRTNNDVAAVADPNTGVAVYDSYTQGGWEEVGGTSVAAPIIASTYALAGTPSTGSYPVSYPYGHTASLFDVTSGSDGSCSPAYLCTGEAGYDGPTGFGTPDGIAAFAPTPMRTFNLALTCYSGLPYGLAVDFGSGWYYPAGSSYASGETKYFSVYIPASAGSLAINTSYCDNETLGATWEGYNYSITPGNSTIGANGYCEDQDVYPGAFVRYCSLSSLTYS
jgi:hypothetical protein